MMNKEELLNRSLSQAMTSTWGVRSLLADDILSDISVRGVAAEWFDAWGRNQIYIGVCYADTGGRFIRRELRPALRGDEVINDPLWEGESSCSKACVERIIRKIKRNGFAELGDYDGEDTYFDPEYYVLQVNDGERRTLAMTVPGGAMDVRYRRIHKFVKQIIGWRIKDVRRFDAVARLCSLWRW
jgi:hypothetical protein